MWVLPVPGVGSVLPLPSSSTGGDRPVAGGVSKLRAGALLAGSASNGVASMASPSSPASPSDTARIRTNEEKKPDGPILSEHVLVDPIDVEFEQIWETLSDFDEEDRQDIIQYVQYQVRSEKRWN